MELNLTTNIKIFFLRKSLENERAGDKRNLKEGNSKKIHEENVREKE